MMEFYLKTLESHCTPKRYEHSIRVSKEALKLADIYNADSNQVEKAGILHDIAKNHSPSSLLEIGVHCEAFDECWNQYPAVWHAFVGPLLIEHEFPGAAEEIQTLVQYHTTGSANMSIEEAIIFVADFIEPGRKDDRSHIAKIAYGNLNKAVANITKMTIEKLESKNNPIHPFTLECWQWYSRFLED